MAAESGYGLATAEELHTFLRQDVSMLSSVGPKRKELLSSLGILSFHDLLFKLPSRYQQRQTVSTLADLAGGEVGVVQVEVTGPAELRHLSGKRSMIQMPVGDESGLATAVWFNQPYRQHQYLPGCQLWLHGKIEHFGRQRFFQVRECGLGSAPPAGLVAVYALKGLIPQGVYAGLIRQVLHRYLQNRLPDIWDDSFRRSRGLLTLMEALQQVHQPLSAAHLERGRKRLAFDQTCLERCLCLRLRREKRGFTQSGDIKLESSWLNSLPYTMTEAQIRCLREIWQDMSAEEPMRRLLQGDVGSGKTVVAAGAAVRAMTSGMNTAFLAPTEVLARQHYQSLPKLLPPSLRVRLILGGSTETTSSDVEENAATLWVGTHALLQESRSLPRLGLLVVDEQHRFGVAQREQLLKDRLPSPDLLCLSATPIPRTLSLVLYGDLSSSVLDQRPQTHRRIRTVWLREGERLPAFMEYCRQEMQSGHKVYWVCPSIDADPELALSSVSERLPVLQEIWPEVKMGMIHGQMKPQPRQEVLEGFLYGDIQLLIGTTVVEVGLDQPQATVIVIENATRFGLAQLHQLRGRVGRGNLRSYCVLLDSSYEQLLEGLTEVPGSIAAARLEALCSSDDGFELARLDLELRGPGEVYGLAQSGFADSFALSWPLLEEEMTELETYLAALDREQLSAIVTALNYGAAS